VPPSEAGDAGAQGSSIDASCEKGTLLWFFCPTVKKRMFGYLAAAASSFVRLFIPAMECGVYCMLLWPPHRTTSPNSTAFSEPAPPSEEANAMSVGAALAGCGGSTCRHTPAASAVAVSLAPLNVVVTVVPFAANPHTRAMPGALCSTIPSPSVLERLNAAFAEASVAARRSDRSMLRALTRNRRTVVARVGSISADSTLSSSSFWLAGRYENAQCWMIPLHLDKKEVDVMVGGGGGALTENAEILARAAVRVATSSSRLPQAQVAMAESVPVVAAEAVPSMPITKTFELHDGLHRVTVRLNEPPPGALKSEANVNITAENGQNGSVYGGDLGLE